MATMKDIAKLAGVSHGTVSNVINNKGNVSLNKITRIKKAIEELGYNKNIQAQYLRNEQSKEVAVVLPNITSKHYRDFYDTLHHELTAHDYRPNIYLTSHMKRQEMQSIRSAISSRVGAIVAVSNLESTKLYNGLQIPVYLVNAPQGSGEHIFNIAFDYKKIAEEIFGRVVAAGYKKMIYFCDVDGIVFDQALLKALEKKRKPAGFEIEAFSSTENFIQNMAVSIFSQTDEKTVVLTSDSVRRNMLKHIGRLLGKPMPALIAIDSPDVVAEERGREYSLDYRRLAAQIARQIVEKNGRSLTVKPDGFHPSEFAAVKKQAAVKLSMITLVGPLSDFLRDFSSKLREDTGIELSLISLPYEELFRLQDSSSVSDFDLIRFDLAWGQRMMKKLCIPLSEHPQATEFYPKFLPSIKEAYIRAGEEVFTLPVDPSIQTMFYRKDLFTDTETQRLYYEKNHKQLKLPGNFGEFDEIASFFTQENTPLSPVCYGTTQTYGSATVAACDFLPRFKAAGGRVTDEAGNFVLASPESVQALTDYVRCARYSPPTVNYWWSDTMRLFSSSQSAMSIVFLNHASRVLNDPNSSVINKVGCALVPGGHPLLGGGCVGISRNCTQIDAAFAFLRWIYSDKIANLLTLYGALSPCKSIFENEQVHRLYPWLREVETHFLKSSRIEKTPVPDFDYYRFEQVLGISVRNAVLGVNTPEQALLHAQTQCEQEFL